MILKKVFYELYETDWTRIRDNAESIEHEIDREIRMEFSDGAVLYFSWSQQPVQYCIGYKEKSWNVNAPERVIDASEWLVWKPFIGKLISLHFLDHGHQVLQISDGEMSVYLSSQEQGYWETDVLHISKEKPDYDGYST